MTKLRKENKENKLTLKKLKALLALVDATLDDEEITIADIKQLAKDAGLTLK